MNKLKLFSAIFVCALMLPGAAAAKEEWLQVRSKNFNLIGNASERDIRKVATRLEQFRETFRQLFNKANLNAAVPTNVVVFKNDAAYKPFKPVRADGKADTFIAGYFQPGEDVNYITLAASGEDADVFGTIFHEYVHSIINTNFGKSEIPPWFNEGLAEYYQTFAIEEDQKVKLGLPQSGHLALLQQNKLIPLETLFKIDNYSLHQNGNHSRSIFYAQSWALIHYLIQSQKTEGLSKFLGFALKDVPAEKAFQDAFQMSYAQMEKELRQYVARNSYQYSMVSFKNKLVFDAEMQVAPLGEAESNAYLGDLLYHTNRHEDAEIYLNKALQINADLSQANTTLGMVKVRRRKFDDAKKYLDKAISEDQKNHLAFYNYAYLLSRESMDEFGFVRAYAPEKAQKMRELLKRAIAVNPNFTESYELLAFVNLVNSEQLDEAVALLQKALKLQPGNQRYALRIAEIYLRQDKFKEAAAIADKIAKTADEADIKSQAENLSKNLRQREQAIADNAAAQKRYEEAVAEAEKNGNRVIVVNQPPKEMSPAEAARFAADSALRSTNEAIRKLQAGETRAVGRIEKIDCKSKSVNYTIKTDNETFVLTSKDFQSLTLTSFVEDATDAQVGCSAANIAQIKAVLTYKPEPNAKTNSRGELIAVDFVPNSFRLMTEDELNAEPAGINLQNAQPSPDDVAAAEQDFEKQRRAAMMQAIKQALRPAQAGEKREIGTLEKIECKNANSFFYFKTAAQTFKLSVASPQALQIRSFTPDAANMQFGCGVKPPAAPVVFTYKENLKKDVQGEIVALEFVPQSFVLGK